MVTDALFSFTIHSQSLANFLDYPCNICSFAYLLSFFSINYYLFHIHFVCELIVLFLKIKDIVNWLNEEAKKA